jgi:hypothetical protein
MNNFLSYLKKADPSIYNAFAGKTVGGSTFDAAWKTMASKNTEKFAQLQHDYIQSSHFSPALSKVEKSTGVDVKKLSSAVQDVLWSTAVQHGSGGAAKVFKNAGVTPGMSDKEIIIRVYAERAKDNGKKYFASSSDSIRKGVVNRFKTELQDALKLLT